MPTRFELVPVPPPDHVRTLLEYADEFFRMVCRRHGPEVAMRDPLVREIRSAAADAMARHPSSLIMIIEEDC